MPQPIRILGIETSCDETAAAIVTRDENDTVHILANTVSSQIALHAPFGGVVPNLAAREHEKNLPAILQETFSAAHLSPNDIDAVAVTNGPGLIPALLVGTTAAKTLSYFWKKPLFGIHHIEGHIYANFVCESKVTSQKAQENTISTLALQTSSSNPSLLHPTPHNLQPHFPLLTLVVSGGHTQLVLMREHFSYEIIGETQDDAVGEAFDKVARILGLGYPGGPAVSAAALGTENRKRIINNEVQKTENGKRKTEFTSSFPLPRPMLHSGDFHFSFSGLKTAVLYAVQKFRKEHHLDETDPLPNAFVSDMCAEFQQAAVDVLVKKTIRAAKKYDAKTVLLAGGVSANTALRTQLAQAVSQLDPSVTCHLSPVSLATDNAAMIAAAAAFRFSRMTPAQKTAALSTWKTLPTRATTPLPLKEKHLLFLSKSAILLSYILLFFL